MPDREALNNYNESIRIADTKYTDWSEEATVIVATDPTVPSAPTIVAVPATEAIDLTITPPTTNTDGSTINDLKEYTVYYSTSSGIDVGNPATYSGTFTTSDTKKTYPSNSTNPIYFVGHSK